MWYKVIILIYVDKRIKERDKRKRNSFAYLNKLLNKLLFKYCNKINIKYCSNKIVPTKVSSY
jgi:hypothetical protein